MAVLTYAHPDWLEDLLASLKRYGWPDMPVRVFRDGAPWEWVEEQTGPEYRRLCEEYDVPLQTLPQWRCIHGNAQQALESSPEDWVFLIQDDNMATPGCLVGVLAAWRACLESAKSESLGILMPPFWHVSDLMESGVVEDLGEARRRLNDIPINPGWGPQTSPRIYIGAHGSSMILRRKLWSDVGGFAKETWCFDEDISCKTWCYSPYDVFQVNGRPFVHGKPGIVGTRPQPLHEFGLERGWIRAWKRTKAECNLLQREAMETVGGDGCLFENVILRERGLLQC